MEVGEKLQISLDEGDSWAEFTYVTPLGGSVYLYFGVEHHNGEESLRLVLRVEKDKLAAFARGEQVDAKFMTSHLPKPLHEKAVLIKKND